MIENELNIALATYGLELGDHKLKLDDLMEDTPLYYSVWSVKFWMGHFMRRQGYYLSDIAEFLGEGQRTIRLLLDHEENHKEKILRGLFQKHKLKTHGSLSENGLVKLYKDVWF